jgi:hypothetical protein
MNLLKTSVGKPCLAALLAVSAGAASAAAPTGCTSLQSEGTNPSSFNIGLSTAVPYAADCYSFTESSSFTLAGLYSNFTNSSPGGFDLWSYATNAYLGGINPAIGNGVLGTAAGAFTAGQYAFVTFFNTATFSAPPNFSYTGLVNINSVSAVPEPETYAMLLAGLAIVGGVARRRKV